MDLYTTLKKQQNYISKLSRNDPIRESLTWYTESNFKEFNKKLRRRGSVMSREELNHRDNIDQAFENVFRLESPLTVYRGIDRDDFISEKEFSDKAFISTSLSYEIARKTFTAGMCCILQITVSPGSKVLPLRLISNNPEEEEILLDRDGIMFCTMVNVVDNMKVFYITYSPKKSERVEDMKDLSNAEDKGRNDLIIEQLIILLQKQQEDDKEEDPDFRVSFDDGIEIRRIYEMLAGAGKKISDKDLEKVKSQLKSQLKNKIDT